jgi:hypothetical protein
VEAASLCLQQARALRLEETRSFSLQKAWSLSAEKAGTFSVDTASLGLEQARTLCSAKEAGTFRLQEARALCAEKTWARHDVKWCVGEVELLCWRSVNRRMEVEAGADKLSN